MIQRWFPLPLIPALLPQRGEGHRKRAFGVALLTLAAALASAQGKPNCVHCGIGIEGTPTKVTIGGKTSLVRCLLCARDLAAQVPGTAEVVAPTEDPAQPLILRSNERGEWTANLPEVVFLETEADHQDCNAWSRAFTSRAAFDAYIKARPGYKDAKPLTLSEWAALEGKAIQGMAMGEMSEMSGMKGMLGPWSMAREGSGTSWLPDASPMFMKPLGKWGRFDANLMGIATANFTDAGGKRGAAQFFSNSMPMVMLRRETGGGIVGARLMGSLDPVFNGRYGYPNLFQTGETAYNRPLKDRQHPHDLISELAVTYTRPVGKALLAHVYLAPVGEPVLGGPMFLMRPSGMEIPESPISHHWFDGTHITAGVATVGLSMGDRWRLEGSAFNGREPDENRYSPDPIRLDSAAARLSFNPGRNWAFNVAYGSIKEPERLEQGIDQHRITAAAQYAKALGTDRTLAVGAMYGQNIKAGHHGRTDAFVLEGTLYDGPTAYYARFERAQKDELVGIPEGTYDVKKLLLGATRTIGQRDGFDIGIGAYVGVYAFPDRLNPYYSAHPVSFGLFLRIRPGAMKMTEGH